MIPILTAIFTGIFATYMLLRALLVLTQDAKEPRPIGTSVPFISPIIDLWRGGSGFWTGPQSRLPIYTLRLPGVRLYIVNATSLIPLIQRQVRSISFVPVTLKMHSTLMNLSSSTSQKISRDAYEDNGAVFGTPHLFHPSLSPGPQLDILNRKSVQIVASSLSKFAEKGAATISLFDWVSGQVLSATTESVYGPLNPFRDPSVAREELVQAFVRYYKEDGPIHPDASPLIQDHYRIHSEIGVSLEDMARLEVAISVAIISNTMPASFWFIYHIFSDPIVLEDCREELSKGVKTQDGVRTVDITHIENSCPVFLSTFQEVFRIHSTSVASRVVLEDHVLDGQYLLKKGGVVLIPASVQHNLDSAWGSDVGKFNHKRFLRQSRGKGYNPVAFRAFGGGSTLCPGRHFVTTEVLTFAALFTLRFDAKPHTTGLWVPPTVHNSNPATSIHQPDHDIQLDIRPRDSHEWAVVFSGSDRKMEISAEDMIDEAK
ncbi:hypothetical protein DHEL01_v206074 [Diaporthe helianthi]|uniref:Cytochrome P450 n=1 Tax=Diaporthe helianthi TaxID=158607 RepID=A0A2P5HZ43_DIAHE|nr:hypothetical protein DHEL01_v206074 [Diaporthe helianthi]